MYRGTLLAFFNQGEVCTCPSRVLVHESIYDRFVEKVAERANRPLELALKLPKNNSSYLDIGQFGGESSSVPIPKFQASQEQFDKILSYLDIGRQEGAIWQSLNNQAKGHNKMRVFQEEIFGPVIAITKFKDEEDALAIANDTEYGLGAGVWTRDTNLAYRMGRKIEAGRIWINCYHAYPAHAFGGYKKSGIGRETHKMMLDHYQNTKNLLVSYDVSPMGFF